MRQQNIVCPSEASHSHSSAASHRHPKTTCEPPHIRNEVRRPTCDTQTVSHELEECIIIWENKGCNRAPTPLPASQSRPWTAASRYFLLQAEQENNSPQHNRCNNAN
jgi:hypothetical protein